MKTNQLFLKICGITEQYNACRASALCTKGALHICRRQMFHTFVCLTRRGVQDTKCFIQSAFTLIELLVNVACKTGVLYNRCGMLSLWGGALKTDKNGQKRISVRRRIRLVSPNNKIPRFSLKVKGYACQCRRCKICGFHPWVRKIL